MNVINCDELRGKKGQRLFLAAATLVRLTFQAFALFFAGWAYQYLTKQTTMKTARKAFMLAHLLLGFTQRTIVALGEAGGGAGIEHASCNDNMLA